MRAINRKQTLTALAALLLTCSPAGLGTAAAQSRVAQQAGDTGVVPDDALTLVVGTRFVAPPAGELSAKELFEKARIPLSDFNETDTCVDQAALDVAKDYFTTLGRVMGKAGHYYFVPDAEIEKAIAMCQRMHTVAPKAWTQGKTKIIAFGRVVPTEEAPALERKVR